MYYYQVSVVETIRRPRSYLVKAVSEQEAIEMAEAGETEYEFSESPEDCLKDTEVVERQVRAAKPLPYTVPEIVVPMTMPSYAWVMLRQQKRQLLELCHLSKRPEDLEGLLALLDHIQDYAVDKCRVPEELVFEESQEE